MSVLKFSNFKKQIDDKIVFFGDKIYFLSLVYSLGVLGIVFASLYLQIYELVIGLFLYHLIGILFILVLFIFSYLKKRIRYTFLLAIYYLFILQLITIDISTTFVEVILPFLIVNILFSLLCMIAFFFSFEYIYNELEFRDIEFILFLALLIFLNIASLIGVIYLLN